MCFFFLAKVEGRKTDKIIKEAYQTRHGWKSKKRNKLCPFFNIKNQRKLEHINDLTYLLKCPRETCSKSYLGETAKKLMKGY